MKKLSIALVAAAMTLSPGVVQAQLVSVAPPCGSVFIFGLFTPTPLACSGAWDAQGLNPEQAGDQTLIENQLEADLAAYLGVGGSVEYVVKADAGQNTGLFNVVPGTTSGNVTFDTPLFGYFILGLKASNNISFYLFNGNVPGGISQITYTTLGTSVNGGGTPQALSHAQLYGVFAPGPTQFCTVQPCASVVTPEPSTYALMGAGLAALGFIGARRRRKNLV